MSTYHPELARGRFLYLPLSSPTFVRLIRRAKMRVPPAPADIAIETVHVPGPDGAPPVALRIYRPRGLAGAAPALFWIHGGGFIMGSPLQDEARSIAMARTLGITVVATSYRLAPDNPAPAALFDAYAGLRWVFATARERGIDPQRIAIGGASAGGGLAASLALLAHDRGEVTPAFQLLVYPMLDDRTVVRTDHDTRHARMWTAGSNRYGWTSHLGTAPGSPGVSPYAAAARREDVGGLPPAWIGVGTVDIFHDEDVAYAARLNHAGVPCELVTVPGAFHGFDSVFDKAQVTQEFFAEQVRALRHALFPPG